MKNINKWNISEELTILLVCKGCPSKTIGLY